MIVSKSVLTQILILGFWLGLSQSLRFDIKSGQSKCFSEEIEKNVITIGKYHVVNPNEDSPLTEYHELKVRVMSINTKKYHRAYHVQSGEFMFTSTESASYTTCFWAALHDPTLTLTVDFDWKTVIAVTSSDMDDIVTKSSVYVMEMEFRKMMDSVKLISNEMRYLIERRLEKQELNESTNSEMLWLRLLPVFVILSVASLQPWYLNNYFKKNKLI